MYNFSAISNAQSKRGTNQNFSQNLDKIKNQKQDQNIEDEYIRGLQDEVKYLEYELKLLKDKELEQQQSLSQLDQFFGDGVPLNENILAMKNQYTVQKTDLENQFQKMATDELRKEKQNHQLREQLAKLEEFIKLLTKEIEDKEDKYKKSRDNLRIKFYQEFYLSKEYEEEYQEKVKKIRQLQDAILKIQKEREKEELFAHTNPDTKEEERARTKNKLKTLYDDLIQLNKEIQQIKQYEGSQLNPLNLQLAQENDKLQQKCMFLEKQITITDTKINELKYLLAQRQSEREHEAQEKRNLQQELDELMEKIENERKLNEVVILTKVKDSESSEKYGLQKEQQKLAKQIHLYKERLARCDTETRDCIDKKLHLQHNQMNEDSKKEKFDEDYERFHQQLHEQRNEYDVGIMVQDELSKQLVPLQKNIKELNDEQQILELKNIDLMKQIEFKRKKFELSQQLKQFKVDQLQVLQSNTSQVNNNIQDLMRRWENIQRQVTIMSQKR